MFYNVNYILNSNFIKTTKNYFKYLLSIFNTIKINCLIFYYMNSNYLELTIYDQILSNLEDS